jgi:hypothetical protein
MVLEMSREHEYYFFTNFTLRFNALAVQIRHMKILPRTM